MMNATTRYDGLGLGDRATLTSEELAIYMGCGRKAAIQAGTDAGARIQIGRRVFWNVKKVQEYFDSISE